MPRNKQNINLDPRERDFTILRGFLESRLMTLAHVAMLYFEGKAEAAKKRVQKLKAADLLGEHPRRPREPSILFLTKRGFRLLREGGRLDDPLRITEASVEKRARVRRTTIAHELEVMNAKAAICQAARTANDLTVEEFSTWPKLYEFRARRPGVGDLLTVQPDGFLRIAEGVGDDEYIPHNFFIEVDRSTETLVRLVQRVQCYRDYYTSGGFAVRNGATRDEVKDFPFRVLMVFRSTARRDNFAHELLNITPPVLSLAWLSTRAEVEADPLGSIWHEPLDYRRTRAPSGRRLFANVPGTSTSI